MNPEARQKWWQEKIGLKYAPDWPGLLSLSSDLSPPEAYTRIDGGLPQSVIGAGRERAVIAPVEPGDTLHLFFHGVGGAGDAATARLWGLEPRGHGYDGRHLADMLLRLGDFEFPEGGFCRRPPARVVTLVDFPIEKTPFPGILSRWKRESGNMAELMMGVWDYTAYIVEITMQAPTLTAGSTTGLAVAPMQACAALWQAFPHPKPLTDEQIRKHLKDSREWMRQQGIEFGEAEGNE